ncbi:hypothetical protein Tco_1075633 [Tanacetum coccineum]
MVPSNILGLDLASKLVNETSYKGMIGSLIYLITTRPNIKFFIVLCARYQSNPKESHLTVVKRILRYLKGTPTPGLYYPKCSGFDLKGYSDSDYAGCSMDRKSTSSACQILGGKLVLGGNYSSTKQINSIQQMIAYCLITGTEGLEALGILPQKRKNPKSKKTLAKTKVTPPPSQQRVLSNPTQSHRAPYLIPKIHRETYKSLENDEDEVFAVVDDMEEDTQAEASVSYVDLKASIKGYYEENVYHRDQTNKVINAAMNSFDKNNIARGDLLNALNGVTETLKAIQDAVKEDLVLNKKVLEATEAYTKSSTNLTKLLTLIKKFDFQRLKSSVESLQATALIQ